LRPRVPPATLPTDSSAPRTSASRTFRTGTATSCSARTVSGATRAACRVRAPITAARASPARRPGPHTCVAERSRGYPGLRRNDRPSDGITARRLNRALGDAQPLQAAGGQAAGVPAPAPADVLGVFRALARTGVRYVLVGELAEALQGSPLLPITNMVAIVAVPASARPSARRLRPALATQRRGLRCP